MRINLRHLLAINKYAASTEETRYYLCGVFITALNGRGHMVATDGHVLLATSLVDENPPDTSIILPSSVLDRIRLGRKDDDFAELTVDDRQFQIALPNGSAFNGEGIDGVFPDWQRVIPKEIKPAIASFDPLLLAKLQQAWTAATGGKHIVGVIQNGDSPAFVKYPDDTLFGVIMPLPAQGRPDSPTSDRPAWL